MNPNRLLDVRVQPAPCPTSPFPIPSHHHLLLFSEFFKAPGNPQLGLAWGPHCAGGCRVVQQHVPAALAAGLLWGALSGAGT